jgi:hypothetical protein
MAAAKTRGKAKAGAKASTKKSSTKKSGNGGFSLRELTDKQKATLGKRIIALRKKGATWEEVTEATGVPGGITGRKLMRLAGGTGAESAIRAGGGGTSTRKSGSKAKAKTTSKRGKAAGSTTRAKARGTKAKGGTTVKGKTRRKAKSGN